MNDFWYNLLTLILFMAFVIFAIVVFTILLKNKTKIEDKKDLEDEIKKTDAHDILNQSPNSDVINSAIEREQNEFRERIRNRLNKNIHRSGSESIDSNNS